jgi:hypothetical protein
MSVQPGVGYTFADSSQGTALTIQQAWAAIPLYGADDAPQQFECRVFKKPKSGGGYDFFLRTAKGVVDYTWTQFPFRPQEEPLGNGEGGQIMKVTYEKQARITDWAVYQNGTRTAGTATDGADFEWMAGNGYVKLPAGASGASVLVTISKIDWWDRDDWLADYRLIEAEVPFVSVFPQSDSVAVATLATQQGCSLFTGGFMYVDTGAMGVTNISIAGGVPLKIGYTYKKIAQLDWNDTTGEWDVTQYEYGPITLPMHCEYGIMGVGPGPLPSPSVYEQALADEFEGVLNYAWFESTWAIPGYTLNPSSWWYHLVNS